MKIAAIHQPQYLPYLGFFHKVRNCDLFIAMDSVQFERRGVQHRNKIKTPQGEQWLTVPVIHRSRAEETIGSMEINNEIPWSRKHWNSIQTNYARSPYFEKYAPDLQHILSRNWSNLCELNMELIQWMMRLLDINKPIIYLSELNVDGSKSQLLINACKAVGANTYLSGSGGRGYMDLDAFATADIDVMWQEFSFPSYPQILPELGFISHLSIIDTLFCWGVSEINKFLQT
jgi:hypothetical protein